MYFVEKKKVSLSFSIHTQTTGGNNQTGGKHRREKSLSGSNLTRHKNQTQAKQTNGTLTGQTSKPGAVFWIEFVEKC